MASNHSRHLVLLAIAAGSVGLLIGWRAVSRTDGVNPFKRSPQSLKTNIGCLQMGDDDAAMDGFPVWVLGHDQGLQGEAALISEETEYRHTVEVDHRRGVGTIKPDPRQFGLVAHNSVSISGLTTSDVARPAALDRSRAPDVALSAEVR